jgi:hypothetical protein
MISDRHPRRPGRRLLARMNLAIFFCNPGSAVRCIRNAARSSMLSRYRSADSGDSACCINMPASISGYPGAHVPKWLISMESAADIPPCAIRSVMQLEPHARKPIADQVGRRIIPIMPGSRALIDEPHDLSAHLSEPVLRRNVEIVRAEVEQADREYRFRRSCENPLARGRRWPGRVKPEARRRWLAGY